jgi:hypothetical protein
MKRWRLFVKLPAIFWALHSDVRWRLCPTSGDTDSSWRAAPLVLGRSPEVLIQAYRKAETFRISGGGGREESDVWASTI